MPQFLYLFRMAREEPKNEKNQSQKTEGFWVANFATLSDERISCSKIVVLSNTKKEPCVRKFEGLPRSKHLGISQTRISKEYSKKLSPRNSVLKSGCGASYGGQK